MFTAPNRPCWGSPSAGGWGGVNLGPLLPRSTRGSHETTSAQIPLRRSASGAQRNPGHVCWVGGRKDEPRSRWRTERRAYKQTHDEIQDGSKYSLLPGALCQSLHCLPRFRLPGPPRLRLRCSHVPLSCPQIRGRFLKGPREWRWRAQQRDSQLPRLLSVGPWAHYEIDLAPVALNTRWR